MRPPLSFVPALPAAVGIAAGVLAYYVAGDGVWLPLAAGCAAALLFWLRWHYLSFTAAFVCIGWLVACIDDSDTGTAPAYGVRDRWTGTVDDVSVMPSATRLLVTVDSCGMQPVATFRCSALVPNPESGFLPGDRVVFSTRLIDPVSTADLPDETTFNPTVFTDKVTALAYLSPDDITVVGFRHSLCRVAFDLQQTVNNLICHAPVKAATAAFISASVLGDRNAVDEGLRRQFRAEGTAHYLALSGFHVGVIAAMASLALWPVRLTRRFGRWRHLAVIAIVWLYAFVCGLSPSLVRASVLITVYLLAKVLQRQTSPYNSLCVAAIIILTVAPRQLFAPGFQLSFAAVLSILAFSRALNPFGHRRRLLHAIGAMFAVPVAAMLGTWVITAAYFHTVTLLFLVPNVVMAVLLPIFICGSIVLIILAAAGVKAVAAGWLLDGCYDLIASLTEWFADVDPTRTDSLWLEPAAVVLVLCAVALLGFGVNFRSRSCRILSAAALTGALAVSEAAPALPAAELYITRRTTRTDMVVRDGDRAFVVTTAPPTEYEAIAHSLRRRYAGYLSRRGCEPELEVVNGPMTTAETAFNDGCLRFCGKTFVMPVNDSLVLRPPHTDYLVATRAMGARPWDALDVLRPDTVILSRDLPPKRRDRIADSCRVRSIPVTDLHQAPFAFIKM